MRLEQSVLPAFVPPPPADRLVKRIAAKQVGGWQLPAFVQRLSGTGLEALVVMRATLEAGWWVVSSWQAAAPPHAMIDSSAPTLLARRFSPCHSWSQSCLSCGRRQTG